MLLRISHETMHTYSAPVPYALQRLRLTPKTGPTQDVGSWTLTIEGAKEEVRFSDQFGNDTRLISVSGDPHTIVIRASGEVSTRDTAGVTGPHAGFAPLWLFRQQTPLTEAGPLISDIAHGVEAGSELDHLHGLMHAIRDKVAYRLGATDAATAAEDAVAKGEGVCQDHTHIFLAAARRLGFPARYVSGYLRIDDTIEQTATHAWAEAHVSNLGWVAFDVSNGIAPDERYVRIATGRDYRDAMPASGIRLGPAKEQLEVHITVEQ